MEKADKVLRIEKIKQIERNKNGSSKSNGVPRQKLGSLGVDTCLNTHPSRPLINVHLSTIAMSDPFTLNSLYYQSLKHCITEKHMKTYKYMRVEIGIYHLIHRL
ncbi:hypothetical protein YC2023_025331 [Brassica napus]